MHTETGSGYAGSTNYSLEKMRVRECIVLALIENGVSPKDVLAKAKELADYIVEPIAQTSKVTLDAAGR